MISKIKIRLKRISKVKQIGPKPVKSLKMFKPLLIIFETSRWFIKYIPRINHYTNIEFITYRSIGIFHKIVKNVFFNFLMIKRLIQIFNKTRSFFVRLHLLKFVNFPLIYTESISYGTRIVELSLKKSSI